MPPHDRQRGSLDVTDLHPPPLPGPPPPSPLLQDARAWRAYCHFHHGEHDKALACYTKLMEDTSEPPNPILPLYVACCHYYMGDVDKAIAWAEKVTPCSLQTRLLMHAANKNGDDNRVMELHGSLQADDLADRLSLAAMHFLRGSFEQASEIYKGALSDHKEFTALNMYAAMCYARLDFWDVSNELIQAYTNQFPDSVLACNLRAYNALKKGSPKEAESELRQIDKMGGEYAANAITRHNMCVFRGGRGALQVFPPMGDAPPEARLNLCIYHLLYNQVDEAQKVLEDVNPVQHEELILKGVAHTMLAQDPTTPSQIASEHLRQAQELLETVGMSDSEKDTIPGRQAQATAFLLAKNFDQAVIYLDSIKEYVGEQTSFLWNYGIARAAVGDYHEALQLLLRITDATLTNDFVYTSWLTRCLVMTGDADSAWERYHMVESTQDAYQLLQQIANDAYRVGKFLVSAKAFDVLERLDPNPEDWAGKRGACVGVVQAVLAGKEDASAVREVCDMLRGSEGNREAEQLFYIISNWAEGVGIMVAGEGGM